MSKRSATNTEATRQHLLGSARLTTPATVALVGYVLLALLVLMPVRMYVYDPRSSTYVQTKYDFAQRLLLVVFLFFPFFLGVYSVNCMVVGNCRLWSWIVAVATLVWAILVIATAAHYRAFRLDDMSSAPVVA